MYTADEEGLWNLAYPLIKDYLEERGYGCAAAVEMARWREMLLQWPTAALLEPRMTFEHYQQRFWKDEKDMKRVLIRNSTEGRNETDHRDALFIYEIRDYGQTCYDLMRMIGDQRRQDFFLAIRRELDTYETDWQDIKRSIWNDLENDMGERAGQFCTIDELAEQQTLAPEAEAALARMIQLQYTRCRVLLKTVRHTLMKTGSESGMIYDDYDIVMAGDQSAQQLQQDSTPNAQSFARVVELEQAYCKFRLHGNKNILT